MRPKVTQVNEALILEINGGYAGRSVKVVSNNLEATKVRLYKHPMLAFEILRDAGEGATADTVTVELTIKNLGENYKILP